MDPLLITSKISVVLVSPSKIQTPRVRVVAAIRFLSDLGEILLSPKPSSDLLDFTTHFAK